MLTAVLALLLLRAPLMLQSLDTLDESLVLVYAQEVLDGRVTHRDFFTVYGPAQFWLVAAFFKALGSQSVDGTGRRTSAPSSCRGGDAPADPKVGSE